MRRHDLTSKCETDPRELSFRGLEQEPEVECAGPSHARCPRRRSGTSGREARSLRDRRGRRFRPVRRWCGARCSRSARAGHPRRSARSCRILDRERRSTESRHAVAISLRPSRVPQDPLGPRPRCGHERPRPPRSRENCRTFRARWATAAFPIADVLAITLASRSPIYEIGQTQRLRT